MTGWAKDFSFDYYRRLVNGVCATMEPRLFREVPILDPAERHVLLRHDIDCSLEEAVQLAEFEKHLGVRASYYVMMHSLLYDLRHSSALREIAAMGHEVGVHFDLPADCDENDISLVEALIQEDCERLEDLLVRRFTRLPPADPAVPARPNFPANRVNAYAADLM